jgi:CP family cyanate transporter-like MFS transporter
MVELRPASRAGRTGRWGSGTFLLVAAVAVLAVNLRPPLVAVGPLTEQLRADTGLTAAATSMLTTLPLLCFAVLSPAAPGIARRFGLERALVAAALVLLAGCAIRMLPSIPALYLGSAVIGVGIAIANVLVPVVIKRDLAAHLGAVMALYSVTLSLGAAGAAGAAVPLGDGLGSTGGRPSACGGCRCSSRAGCGGRSSGGGSRPRRPCRSSGRRRRCGSGARPPPGRSRRTSDCSPRCSTR